MSRNLFKLESQVDVKNQRGTFFRNSNVLFNDTRPYTEIIKSQREDNKFLCGLFALGGIIAAGFYAIGKVSEHNQKQEEIEINRRKSENLVAIIFILAFLGIAYVLVSLIGYMYIMILLAIFFAFLLGAASQQN